MAAATSAGDVARYAPELPDDLGACPATVVDAGALPEARSAATGPAGAAR